MKTLFALLLITTTANAGQCPTALTPLGMTPNQVTEVCGAPDLPPVKGRLQWGYIHGDGTYDVLFFRDGQLQANVPTKD